MASEFVVGLFPSRGIAEDAVNRLKYEGVPAENISLVLLSEVAQPSRCLFAGDTNDNYLLTLRRESMPGVEQPKSDGTGVFVPEPPRHSGGNNFVFVDGHVQFINSNVDLAVIGCKKVVLVATVELGRCEELVVRHVGSLRNLRQRNEVA